MTSPTLAPQQTRDCIDACSDCAVACEACADHCIRQADPQMLACIRLCLADRACTALTYNARSRACFPKGAANPPVPFAGALSGQVTATDPAVAQAAADRVAGAGAWLRPDSDLDPARRP